MDQADKLREIIDNYSQVTQKNTLNARVITVTSGKGGVGKTNFSINLAIGLRQLGYRVVILDADFGLANIEVLFGVLPKYSLADVIKGLKPMEDVLTLGPLGVQFISGGSGILELVNINPVQRKNLIDNLIVLDSVADYILIDTGAGLSDNVINFIKASNETIIVTTPEPTAITDAYALIKTLKSYSSKMVLPDIKLVVNRVDNENEGIDVYNKLNTVSNKFLDIDIKFLGVIPFDQVLIKAVKRQEPAILYQPNCKFSNALGSISKKIVGANISGSGTKSGIASFVKRLVNIFNNG